MNKDKIKLYNKEYYRKNRKSLTEYHREWCKSHHDEVKKYKIAYLEKNPEKKNSPETKEYFLNYSREYRKTEKWKAYIKDYVKKNNPAKTVRRKLRISALIAYGGKIPKCKCCGENKIELLCIDHTKGNGAEHRKKIGHSSIDKWLKRNNYPKGFRVLCFNCNMSRGIYGYCPHNKRNMKKYNELFGKFL